jgi:hypothetical protein
MLLRLYPRRFRAQFGEGMAQTFHDLCRERADAKRGLFAFTLWIFVETLAGKPSRFAPCDLRSDLT